MTNNSQKDTISEQIESILTSIITDENIDEKNIHQVDETTLQIEDQVYRVVTNYREGFEFAAFEARYQEYFEKFDFIVGDWGYEQLRLRGFYQLNKRKVPREQIIDFLDDYLKEYCNFGCRYFVLAKEEAFLKYNQLVSNMVPQKRQNQISKPVINTKPAGVISTPTPKPEKRKRRPQTPKITQPEAHSGFQINQVKPKKPKYQEKPNTKVTKPNQNIPNNNNKRNFVIKQQP